LLTATTTFRIGNSDDSPWLAARVALAFKTSVKAANMSKKSMVIFRLIQISRLLVPEFFTANSIHKRPRPAGVRI
jgi:hypothetical protein